MPIPHSTVIYVEPNMVEQDFQFRNKDGKTDNFERIISPEDYCIAMNIEVEISSRDSQGSIKDGDKDVLIMQWNNGDGKQVSFMGGTKIGGYTYNGINRTPNLSGTTQNLTTYYADMYVGDLIHYGTTEMIGVKSVNIEYAKSCVPIITVQFTDVRGLSLFQPTELSRDNTYNGIKGLNKDNVAQSFFQSFFKMPLPKFTIYIKGFYGNPVAYVCMCDKFDTNFNSDTGDFDVTARFIGYSYSFMTDVSFDALLAAPYSDFEGKQYWEEQKDNDRFWIWDKHKTHHVPMPTLYEIYRNIKKLYKESDKDIERTPLSEEEKTHMEEITLLKEIRYKYQTWYEKVYEMLKNKYGKRYCFEFREGDYEEADWYRIIVLTNSKTSDIHDLSAYYEQFTDEVKQETNDLFSAIEDFNSGGYSYKKLKNVSKDFSEYTRVKVFNDCYVNSNTRKIEFGGFHPDNRLNRVQVVNRLFYNNNSQEEGEKPKQDYKDFTLSTIYNDGIDQYKNAFIIELDYSDIKRRINVLVNDANKSVDDKQLEKIRKEHNKFMMDKMNWYPSVENFTKIMMAHLETFMMMMYKVAEKCSKRTPKSLGITLGKGGDACDMNEKSDVVPPFPRIVKNEIGDDGITKTVDAWVGSYKNGEGFIEADMINGLFNADSYIQKLFQEDKKNDEGGGEDEPPQVNLSIKHPLTSFDFFLTKNPYGTDNDVSNNPNAFAGKVAMRMFDILSINNFKKQYSGKFDKANAEFIKQLGKIEADNFYDNVEITNNNMLGLLGAKSDNATITPQVIIDCVKNGKPIGDNTQIPWMKSDVDDPLFDIGFWLSKYSTSYSTTDKTFIYPMQDMSFKKLSDTLKIFNKGVNSIDKNNKDIMVNWINASANVKSLIDADNPSCFGSMFIVDDYKYIADALDSANSSADNNYQEMYDLLTGASTFNADKFAETILKDGVFRPRQDIVTLKETCKWKLNNSNTLFLYRNNNSKRMQCTSGTSGDSASRIEYTFDENKLNDYITDVQNKNITSWFFTECLGFKYSNPYHYTRNEDDTAWNRVDNISYKREDNTSLLANNDYVKEIKSANWEYGNDADKLLGFFLMGLEAIDYTSVAKNLKSNDTFTYLPKLAVLQIGAALTSGGNIVLPKTFDKIFDYLNSVNGMTKIAFVKYFKDWTRKNHSLIALKYLGSTDEVAAIYVTNEKDSSGKDVEVKRVLFREDTETMARLVNNLMSAVIVAKGNVNHFKNVPKKGLELDESIATNFLDGFLTQLRSLYGITIEERNGTAIQLVADSSKTSEDMKKELYRYLKLVYDKWVPALDKESWKFETFFDEAKEKEIRGKKGCDGHLFHFIDSFYNKIGDKLLINPRLLADKLDAALMANDVNVMMLGFMSDIYNQNKCMLLSIQNFLDLGKKDEMETMFKPIPFNSMPRPHTHPDFVVVYPYEPSKYLDVDNAEFNNDSFMLNDEFDTPLAVKSRGANEDSYYKIPAFGVSYGKQYQSYFKKVSVGMANPIATQQVIMAKHAILRNSQDTTTKTVFAQDMYDIYATQSYTCSVEMMGCAWVQPLMYFVLTNVPMFRGSYLIFKVTHSITPGNMVTSFQGTRMANVSNKLVEEIFTDEDVESGDLSLIDSRRHKKANVNNDCPYKTFPLFESDVDTDLNGDTASDGVTIMKTIMSKLSDKFGDDEQKKIIAAGIVGNMFQESRFDPYVYNKSRNKKYLTIGLVQWNDNDWLVHDMLANQVKYYGYDDPKSSSTDTNKKLAYKNKYLTSEASTIIAKMKAENKGLSYQINFLVDTINTSVTCKKLREAFKMNPSPSAAADSFRKYYERNDDLIEKRRKSANDFYAAYGNGAKQQKSEPDKDVNRDIYEALYNAVQKSINSTESPFQLAKYEKPINGVLMFKQADGKGDRLPMVFDILLNGYYEYVQKLWWVSPTNRDFLHEPIHIDVEAAESPDPNNREVLVMVTNNANNAKSITFGEHSESNIHKSLLMSLYKRYKSNIDGGGLPYNEFPQFASKEVFNSISIKDCDTLMGNESDGGVSTILNDVKCDVYDGKIGEWNVQKSVDWLTKNAVTPPPYGHGACWKYVKNALKAGGFPYASSESAADAGKFLAENGFKEYRKGFVNGHSGSDYEDKCVGDITVFDRCAGHKHGHINMWCGKKWISDFVQDGNWISSNASTNFTVWRYSGSGGHFSS